MVQYLCHMHCAAYRTAQHIAWCSILHGAAYLSISKNQNIVITRYCHLCSYILAWYGNLCSLFDWYFNLCSLFAWYFNLCLFSPDITICVLFSTDIAICVVFSTNIAICVIFSTNIAICVLLSTNIAIYVLFSTVPDNLIDIAIAFYYWYLIQRTPIAVKFFSLPGEGALPWLTIAAYFCASQME